MKIEYRNVISHARRFEEARYQSTIVCHTPNSKGPEA